MDLIERLLKEDILTQLDNISGDWVNTLIPISNENNYLLLSKLFGINEVSSMCVREESDLITNVTDLGIYDGHLCLKVEDTTFINECENKSFVYSYTYVLDHQGGGVVNEYDELVFHLVLN